MCVKYDYEFQDASLQNIEYQEIDGKHYFPLSQTEVNKIIKKNTMNVKREKRFNW